MKTQPCCVVLNVGRSARHADRGGLPPQVCVSSDAAETKDHRRSCAALECPEDLDAVSVRAPRACYAPHLTSDQYGSLVGISAMYSRIEPGHIATLTVEHRTCFSFEPKPQLRSTQSTSLQRTWKEDSLSERGLDRAGLSMRQVRESPEKEKEKEKGKKSHLTLIWQRFCGDARPNSRILLPREATLFALHSSLPSHRQTPDRGSSNVLANPIPRSSQ